MLVLFFLFYSSFSSPFYLSFLFVFSFFLPLSVLSLLYLVFGEHHRTLRRDRIRDVQVCVGAVISLRLGYSTLNIKDYKTNQPKTTEQTVTPPPRKRKKKKRARSWIPNMQLRNAHIACTVRKHCPSTHPQPHPLTTKVPVPTCFI